MFIMNQSGDALFNINEISQISIGTKANTVRITLKDCIATIGIGNYSTLEEAAAAVDLIATELKGTTKIIKAPTQEKAKMHYLKSRNDREYLHSETGKKVKRHGGS